MMNNLATAIKQMQSGHALSDQVLSQTELQTLEQVKPLFQQVDSQAAALEVADDPYDWLVVPPTQTI
jgi:DnaJ-domain-containing protein 1